MQFLADLKRKDGFYETYRQTVEELTKLREAHSQLIDMIDNHHVAVSDSILETDSEKASAKQTPKGTRTERIGVKSFLSCGVWQDPVPRDGPMPIRPYTTKEHLHSNRSSHISLIPQEQKNVPHDEDLYSTSKAISRRSRPDKY